MTTLTTEVVHLTDAQARDAARAVLKRHGFTFAALAQQAARHSFDSLRARLAWEAVRYVGDPDRL